MRFTTYISKKLLRLSCSYILKCISIYKLLQDEIYILILAVLIIHTF